MLTHARSYLNPLNPLSGIPEGSIDSIDRGSLRARSTRSIGDPLGLDRLDRLDRKSIGDPLGLDRSIDSIDAHGREAAAADNGGIVAHCCGIFSCTNPPVWPVGGVVVAVTAVSYTHLTLPTICSV